MPAPIITREDLGNYLNRNLATDDMALAAVDAASDVCRTVSDQIINEVEGDELVLDGTGTDVLVLPQMPVTDVESVLDSAGAAVDPGDWVLSVVGTLIKPSGTWIKGRQNFTVTYTHGYPDAEIPRDLRMVALSLAGRIYMQGPVVFESIGKRQVRYAGPAMDLSKSEHAILLKYKQTR